MLVVLFGAVVAAGAGVVAGAGARRLLRRLRRGAVVRPPWCEAVVGVLWGTVGAGWAAGAVPGEWVPVLLGLGWLGVAAAAVDLRHRRLPDALTLPALPLAVLLLVPVGSGAVLRAVAGAAVAVVAHALVHLLVPRALGAGDVKLAGPLGAVLAAAAWPALVAAAVLAAAGTAAVGTVGLVTRRLARNSPLPHGPSMLAATWVVTTWVVVVGATACCAGG